MKEETKLIEAMKEIQGERSLREFADDLGISHSTLSMIYSGQRGIGRKVLSALAQSCPKMLGTVTLFLAEDVAVATDNDAEASAQEE